MDIFKNEYEYLVHLVRCALQEIQPTELPKGLSFDRVYEYGKAHEVANISFVSIQRLNKKPVRYNKLRKFIFLLNRLGSSVPVRPLAGEPRSACFTLDGQRLDRYHNEGDKL